MNAYELKQAERKARLEDHAAKLSQSATSTLAQARRMGSAIPFGQPILIGHHSETRDRNYRARITGKMGKGFALMDKASHYADKAASVGHDMAGFLPTIRTLSKNCVCSWPAPRKCKT